MVSESRKSIIKRLRDEFKLSLEANVENTRLKTTTINERMAIYVSINLIHISLDDRGWSYLSTEMGVSEKTFRRMVDNPKDVLIATEVNILKISKSVLANYRKFIPEEDIAELKCIGYPGFRKRMDAFNSNNFDELKSLSHHNIMDWYTQKEGPCVALACEMLSTGFFESVIEELRYGDIILKLANDAVDSYLAYYDKKLGVYKFYSDTFERKNPRYVGELEKDLRDNFINSEGRGEDVYQRLTNVHIILKRDLYEANKLIYAFYQSLSQKFFKPYMSKDFNSDDYVMAFTMFQQGVIGKPIKKNLYEDKVDVGRVVIRNSDKKKSA